MDNKELFEKVLKEINETNINFINRFRDRFLKDFDEDEKSFFFLNALDFINGVLNAQLREYEAGIYFLKDSSTVSDYIFKKNEVKRKKDGLKRFFKSYLPENFSEDLNFLPVYQVSPTTILVIDSNGYGFKF